MHVVNGPTAPWLLNSKYTLRDATLTYVQTTTTTFKIFGFSVLPCIYIGERNTTVDYIHNTPLLHKLMENIYVKVEKNYQKVFDYYTTMHPSILRPFHNLYIHLIVRKCEYYLFSILMK